ncbi:MAG: N-acetylmuramoyl-L-alanine amidase [Verrucomicrobiota bacterium]
MEKHSLRMRAGVACVGLVVLAGSLTLLVTPDPPEEQVFPIAQMPTVVIDAGHGGKDEGAKCKGVQEKTLALDVALRLGRILNARGFSTTQTRTEDVFLTLAERTEIANRVKDPAIFVSIHFNQGSGREIAGIETFYADNKVPTITDWTWVGFFSRPESFDMGEELAAEVQYAAILKTGAKDRGIRARHLFVTRHTRLPAVLVEGGFITNRMESTLLNEEHYADTLAAGIADGIESWWRTQQKSLPSSLARKE